MILLGLDLATQSGFCYGRPDTVPHAGSVKAPSSGKELGIFGEFYWNYFWTLLDGLADRLEGDEGIIITYEAPILPGQTNLATTRKLHGLGLLLETVSALHPAPTAIFETHLASIKKELAGKGDAQKTEMVLAARRCGIKLPDGTEAFDAADAFAAWLIAQRKFAPAHNRLWDQRLYGGKIW